MTYSPNPPKSQPEIKYGRPGPVKKQDYKTSSKHEQTLQENITGFWRGLPRTVSNIYSQATSRLRNFLSHPMSVFRGVETKEAETLDVFDPTSRFISQTIPSIDRSDFAHFEIEDVEYEHFKGPFVSKEVFGESKLATLMRKERLLYEELKSFIQHYFQYTSIPDDLQKRMQFLIVHEFRQGGVKEQVVRNHYTKELEHEKIYREPLALESYNWNKKAEETIRKNIARQVISYCLQDTTNYSYPFRLSNIFNRSKNKEKLKASAHDLQGVVQAFEDYIKGSSISTITENEHHIIKTKEGKNLVDNKHGKLNQKEIQSLIIAYQDVYKKLCTSNVQFDTDYIYLQTIIKGSRDTKKIAEILPKAQKIKALSEFLQRYILTSPTKIKIHGDVLMHSLQKNELLYSEHPLIKSIAQYDPTLAEFLKNLF